MPSKKIAALIDKPSLARMAGVSTATVSRATAAAQITSFRVGRRRLYPRAAIEQLLERTRKGPEVAR